MREMHGNRRVWHVVVKTNANVRPVDDILQVIARAAVPSVRRWQIVEADETLHLWEAR